MKGEIKSKKELRKWMNFYHNKWIECHNKLVEIKSNKKAR
jgi:hypothetical protein